MGRLPSSLRADSLKLTVCWVGRSSPDPCPRGSPLQAVPEPGQWEDAPVRLGRAGLPCGGQRPFAHARQAPRAARRASRRPQARWGRAGPALAPAVPRLRSGRGAGAGPAGEAQDAREPMGKLGGAGLAAAAGRARTLGMEGERLASPARSSGLPAGGAGGESPGVDAPLLGSSGSSALLQAEVLDLDEDEDDLEVFSKVRAAAAARPGKVPSQLQELAPWCGGRPASSPGPGGGSGLRMGGVSPGLPPGRAPNRSRSLLCTLTFPSPRPWFCGVCKVVIFPPLFSFLL